MDPVIIATPRLRLRLWKPADLAPFAAMNADPRVMEFYPQVLTCAESDAVAARVAEGFAKHGFGLWALEIPGVETFAGFVGLSVPRWEANFTPCVEVGWRLAAKHWGHGYATEAARAAVAYGFDAFGLQEIVSFTATQNLRSQAVMRRIGMERRPELDFDHPVLDEGHRLRRHVFYRVRPSFPGRGGSPSRPRLPGPGTLTLATLS